MSTCQGFASRISYIEGQTIWRVDSLEEPILKPLLHINRINLTFFPDRITGRQNKAGIIYGLEGIPDNWLSQLRNKELLESCLF